MAEQEEKEERIVKRRIRLEDFDAFEAEGKSSIGFSVGGSPIWLFKQLFLEARESYGDVYWPVLVGWCKDAMLYRQLRDEALMASSLSKEDVKVDVKDDKMPKLMG